MKNIFKLLFLSILIVSYTACNLDLVNPNAATEEQVLKTKDGLFGLAVGMEDLYATSALGSAINTVAITTREAAAVTTYSSLEGLEDGGAELSGDNERVSRTFSRTHRVKGMAEDIIANVEDAELSDDTKSGLYGIANLYRAMCLGILAQNWEQVAILNSRDGNAAFSSRMDAYNEAISILKASISRVESKDISAEFASVFMPKEELLDKLNAYLARYELFAGNYQDAIDAANKVDKTKAYFFNYDSENKNPVYVKFIEDLVELAPRDNFGLASELAVDPADGRLAFYFSPVDTLSLAGLPVDKLVCPFFLTDNAPIPFYNPSEMDLIVAEAYARMDKLTEAETALNKVRMKTADNDPLGYGLAAGFDDTYTANGSKIELLKEIYKNRRMETYLSGMALEDSRRFNRPDPPASIDYTTERNRNFYPYPASERARNANTPEDPQI